MSEGSEAANDQWQVAKVTGIGKGELWFDVVEDDLGKQQAHHRARGSDRYIAIPMDEVPDDWGERWLNGELEDDPYA